MCNYTEAVCSKAHLLGLQSKTLVIVAATGSLYLSEDLKLNLSWVLPFDREKLQR